MRYLKLLIAVYLLSELCCQVCIWYTDNIYGLPFNLVPRVSLHCNPGRWDRQNLFADSTPVELFVSQVVTWTWTADEVGFRYVFIHIQSFFLSFWLTVNLLRILGLSVRQHWSLRVVYVWLPTFCPSIILSVLLINGQSISLAVCQSLSVHQSNVVSNEKDFLTAVGHIIFRQYIIGFWCIQKIT